MSSPSQVRQRSPGGSPRSKSPRSSPRVEDASVGDVTVVRNPVVVEPGDPSTALALSSGFALLRADFGDCDPELLDSRKCSWRYASGLKCDRAACEALPAGG
jgi:hypothetical protein